MSGSVSATSPRRTPSRRGRSPRFSSDGSSHGSSGHLGHNYPTETATIFASSLDIRVEGALPIKDDSEDETPSRMPQSANLHDTEKRTPRKSKTDALTALNNQTRSSSLMPDEDEVDTNITAKYRNGTAIPVPATLDLSSVKTAKRHQERCAITVPRPFGLKDCPEYYPTTEQFKDPLEYIKSIAEEAKEYGICKIVPPSDWKMPFVTNTEVCGE
jgi:histone demethylase JARID1